MKLTLQIQTFYKCFSLALVGFLFYYGYLFLGAMNGTVIHKLIALVILAVTVPLPIMAMYQKQMFKGVNLGVQHLLKVFTLGILFHHAVMTFIVIMFSKTEMGF